MTLFTDLRHAARSLTRAWGLSLTVMLTLALGIGANTAVFSAMVEYLNRADPKREPRRIPQVVNNHIIKGGHLSAQPMGALRDYVARHRQMERPAVEEFPVLPDNPYRIDVPAACAMLDAVRPELIVFGKSMVLHREPVVHRAVHRR